MSQDLLRSTRAQLAGMVLLSFATFAAFWAGMGLEDAWPALALLLAFTAVVHVGRRRSTTLEVLGGIGDERTSALYTRAGALTCGVISFALPGWWLVTVAQGEPNTTLSLVCAVVGVTFIGSCLVVARRG